MAPRAKTPPSPREAPTDDIDKLNAIVRKRVYDMGGDGIEPEAVKAVKGGAQVYHRRTRALVYGVGVLAVAMLAGAPSAAFAAAALAAMWIVTDVYGAVLHVVLDTPEFINAPIVSAVIGPACLEFQWHHTIPLDITQKEFVEVCGDLSLAVILHVANHALIWGGPWCAAANAVGAAKIMMAFLGQYAHRMAHTPESGRPAIVRAAQSIGLLVHPDLHRVHHATHDKAFPILSGLSTKVIDAALAVVPDRRIWLAGFVVMSLTDIYVVTKILCAAFDISPCA